MRFIDPASAKFDVKGRERVVLSGSFVLDGAGDVKSGKGMNVTVTPTAEVTGGYTLTVNSAAFAITAVRLQPMVAEALQRALLLTTAANVATLQVTLETATESLSSAGDNGTEDDEIFYQIEGTVGGDSEYNGCTFEPLEIDSTPAE